MGDKIVNLKEWAKITQGVPPDQGSDDNILQAVLRHDYQVQNAALSLPFEIEPASYTRTLEKIAEDITPI